MTKSIEKHRKLITELNEFVAALDERIREAAFKFLLQESDGADAELKTVTVSKPHLNREVSPQELIRQTDASSAMAKAEVLGYWLELHQGKQSFSSGDIKDAFAHAREPAPKNPSDVVAKLASSGKLMPDHKSGAIQYYRLTRTAIDEVESWLRAGNQGE